MKRILVIMFSGIQNSRPDFIHFASCKIGFVAGSTGLRDAADDWNAPMRKGVLGNSAVSVHRTRI